MTVIAKGHVEMLNEKIKKLEAQIEKMKVCDNCKNNNPIDGDGICENCSGLDLRNKIDYWELKE